VNTERFAAGAAPELLRQPEITWRKSPSAFINLKPLDGKDRR
jgi:hypothetical protein